MPTSNSDNGRLRDECLNELWFLNVVHAKVVIEAWRQREYNEGGRRRHWLVRCQRLDVRSAGVTTGL